MESVVLQKTLSQSSVEIATGSKGEIKLTVKSYEDDIYAASTKAQATFDSLQKKYAPTA